jgi:GR25 family glycosyltransferase involved in LPS biosynthesis
LSHALLLDEIIGRGWRSALILEDDVDLAGDPATWSERLHAAYRDLPASWELWYLYRCLDIAHRVRRISSRTVIPWTPQGCAAFAVTAAGARIIRDATRPVGNAVDRVLMNVVKTRGIKAYAASPMLVDPGQMASLINTQPGQRTWVDNGVNRPPEYWPEEYLAHLGERVPGRRLHQRLWRAGTNYVQQMLHRPKGIT